MVSKDLARGRVSSRVVRHKDVPNGPWRVPQSPGSAAAVACTGWNYGPGWERVLLDAYGIKPDTERTRYYRLL